MPVRSFSRYFLLHEDRFISICFLIKSLQRQYDLCASNLSYLTVACDGQDVTRVTEKMRLTLWSGSGQGPPPPPAPRTCLASSRRCWSTRSHCCRTPRSWARPRSSEDTLASCQVRHKARRVPAGPRPYTWPPGGRTCCGRSRRHYRTQTEPPASISSWSRSGSCPCSS